MKNLTLSLFVCTILMNVGLQVNARTRKIDENSTLAKLLGLFKDQFKGNTYNDNRDQVFKFQENKEWKDIAKTTSYKKALKNYLDRVLHIRNMEATAIHLNGVNILALTPKDDKFDEESDNLKISSWKKQNDQGILSKNLNGGNLNDQVVILSPRQPLNSKTGNSLRRTVFSGPGEVILGAPSRPEHLPKALPILPGHTLLRPARGMLKSAVKYPLRDFGDSAVYGNLKNLGITFGKTRARVRYTDFRKSNKNFMNILQHSIQQSKMSGKTRPLIIIELEPSEVLKIKDELQKKQIKKQIPDEENNASEILDDLDSLFDRDNDAPDYRRKKKHRKKSKYRNRGKFYLRKPGSSGSSSSDDDDTTSSSEEKNPGNPFTLYKNKYRQNWMWNHKMDGTHMNVNPYAPNLNQFGPSGAELFFARKWWYFNQDDYKPLGRKR